MNGSCSYYAIHLQSGRDPDRFILGELIFTSAFICFLPTDEDTEAQKSEMPFPRAAPENKAEPSFITRLLDSKAADL